MVKKHILITSLLVLTIYLLVSFVSLTINFIKWTPDQREAFSFFSGAIILASTFIYISLNNEKESQK